MAHVRRTFTRPPKADIEAMARYSPATIHEAWNAVRSTTRSSRSTRPEAPDRSPRSAISATT